MEEKLLHGLDDIPPSLDLLHPPIVDNELADGIHVCRLVLLHGNGNADHGLEARIGLLVLLVLNVFLLLHSCWLGLKSMVGEECSW